MRRARGVSRCGRPARHRGHGGSGRGGSRRRRTDRVMLDLRVELDGWSRAGCGGHRASSLSPGARMRTSAWPTSAVAPSATRCRPSTPSAGLSNSTAALSVSISAIDSPAATVSPGCLSHRASVPSSIDTPISGITTSFKSAPFAPGLPSSPCRSQILEARAPHPRTRPLEHVRLQRRPETRPVGRGDEAVGDDRQLGEEIAVPAAVEGAHRLLQDRVRGADGEVRPRGQADRAGAVVRRDRHAVELRERSHLLGLGETTAPAEVEHEVADVAALEQLVVARARADRLAERAGQRRAVDEARDGEHVVELDRVLDPVGLVVLERARDRLRRAGLPERVQLDHDVHAVTDGRAHLLDRLERLAHLLGRDREAVVRQGGAVERPDLHRRQTLREQVLGELVGPVQERVEVLVGAEIDAVLREVPVVDRLGGAHLPVPRARARVVGADAARGTVRRAAGRAARPPTGRGCPRARRRPRSCPSSRRPAPAPPRERVVEAARVALDVARLLAEQPRSRDLVQVALDGVEVQARLAKADDALVGHELQPAERRQLLAADRDELDKPHPYASAADGAATGRRIVEQDAARALGDAVAAVDGQLDAGHELGGVGGQEERGADEVGRVARSGPRASCGAPRSRSRRPGAARHGGLDPAGQDRVGADAVRVRARRRARARGRGCRPWPRRTRRRAAVRRPSTWSRG